MIKQLLKHLAKNFVRCQKFSCFFPGVVGDVPFLAHATTSPTTPGDASKENGHLPLKQVNDDVNDERNLNSSYINERKKKTFVQHL